MMRAIPVCFSLAILVGFTHGARAEEGGPKQIVKPVETVIEVPIKIIEVVVSPITKPKG
jgi:hypothetical protein